MRQASPPAPEPTALTIGLPPIARVAASAYTVPTDAPEADGTLSWTQTTLVLVEASAAGAAGIGWTYAPPPAAAVAADLLAPLVTGMSAADVPRARERMYRAVRNAGRTGLCACAISAVDCALWDLKARLLGLPLHVLLGTQRDDVPIYGSGAFTSYDDETTRNQLGRWVHAEHIPRVKIKIGEDRGHQQARDLHRIALARETIGPAAELYVDANGGYRDKQAIRMADAFADAGVTWYEEPVSSDDLAGLRAVREASSADVTAGEYGYDLGYFQRMCDARAVDCLQADATRCGGVTGWLAAATVAAAHNLDISAHCAPTQHARIAVAVPNLRHLEWFHDHVRIESRLFDGAPRPGPGGVVVPDDAPGFGVAFKHRDAERYRVG